MDPKAQAPSGEPRDDLGAGLGFILRNVECCCPQCPLPSVAKSTKQTLLSGAVGKAPFPHAAMRDSSGQPRTRMGSLFSAGRAWARQGARYEDTTGIDSEHAFPVPRATPAHLCLGTRQRASALPFRPSCGPSFMHTKRFAQSEGAGTVRFVPELVWRMAWAGLGPLSQCRTISACFWAQLQPCSREALGTRAWAGTRSWPHRSPMCRMGPEDKGVCPGGTRF